MNDELFKKVSPRVRELWKRAKEATRRKERAAYRDRTLLEHAAEVKVSL